MTREEQQPQLTSLLTAINKAVYPRLLKRLEETLPKKAGKCWWSNCVVPALKGPNTKVPKRARALGDLDLPTLVAVYHINQNLLRYEWHVGAEFLDALYSLVHFRNDVYHLKATSEKLTDDHLITVIHNTKIVLDVLDPNQTEFDVDAIKETLRISPSRSVTKKRAGVIVGVTGCLAIALAVGLYLTREPSRISADQAADFSGKTMTVCGRLVEIKTVKGMHWLNFDQPYPANVFSARIVDNNVKHFPDVQTLEGQRVCVKGPIRPVGRAKTMIELTWPDQLRKNSGK